MMMCVKLKKKKFFTTQHILETDANIFKCVFDLMKYEKKNLHLKLSKKIVGNKI